MTMNLTAGNLLEGDDAPPSLHESSRDLYANGAVRIARIASNAYSSPEDFWYEQDDDEWVALVSGDAVIEFADGTWHCMGAGDWIVIPAGMRHRIAGTDAKTVWLAVHAKPAATRIR